VRTHSHPTAPALGPRKKKKKTRSYLSVTDAIQRFPQRTVLDMATPTRSIPDTTFLEGAGNNIKLLLGSGKAHQHVTGPRTLHPVVIRLFARAFLVEHRDRCLRDIGVGVAREEGKDLARSRRRRRRGRSRIEGQPLRLNLLCGGFRACSGRIGKSCGRAALVATSVCFLEVGMRSRTSV